MTATVTQQNLTNLLRYAEGILKISERVIADLAKDSFLTLHEQDLLGLEGVSANSDDGSWVRLARLHEIPPPPNEAMFDDWITTPTASRLFDKPRLADSRLVKVSVEVASDLIEAGLAGMEDVMTSLGDVTSDQVDVLLRLPNLTEFAAAFASYADGPWSEWSATEQPRRRSIAIYNKLYTVQQQ
jgi:hypothetical protein